MNHPDFTNLRRKIDEALTFHDFDAARGFVDEGLRIASEKECLGEIMYFHAQREIIAECFPEAMEYLLKALMYNPSDGAAYNDLALCRIALGVMETAEELFDKGIEVEPDYATIHHNKGWFLNKIGRHQEALLCFQKALDLEPGRVVTYENMADAYENLGRVDEALGAYKKSFELMRFSGPIRDQIKGEIERLERKRA